LTQRCIVTAPLIVALGMKLSPSDTAYLVSSSLIISGVATFIQIHRFGPIGSGLLSIQGTSFTFIGPLIFAYFTLLEGDSVDEALGAVLGTSAVCALCMLVCVQFVEKLRRWVTCNVSGATVALIGLTLVWTTLKNLNREYTAAAELDYPAWWLLALAAAVFLITLAMVRSGQAYLRMSSITVGLIFGLVSAWLLGIVDMSALDKLETTFYPQPNKFPLSFDLAAFFILMPAYLISSTESVGDLTATSKLSGLTIGDKSYWQRIRGGLSADAVNSFIAAIFSTFPNTTFSQNNGVIRMTGVCSTYVGLFVAGILCLLGLFPVLGSLLVILPGAVLSGATLLMFFMVFLSGLVIVSSGEAHIKSWPIVIAAMVQFPISSGAICAFLLEVLRSFLPEKLGAQSA